MVCRVADSADRMGPAQKAIGLEFSVSEEIQLQPEIGKSIEFIRSVGVATAAEFWTQHLSNVREISEQAKTTQSVCVGWGESRIPESTSRPLCGR